MQPAKRSSTLASDTSGQYGGHFYNKYESSNPIENFLVKGYLSAVLDLARLTKQKDIHDVGTGEGYVARFLAKHGFNVRGSDYSEDVIKLAQGLSEAEGLNIKYEVRDIYKLNIEQDKAPIVMCCQSFEHLEDPHSALAMLAEVADPYFLVTIPREPLWRFLNCLRGKYLKNFGNTPGHIQHWSKRSFVSFLNEHFDIIDVRAPLPWIAALCKVRREGM